MPDKTPGSYVPTPSSEPSTDIDRQGPQGGLDEGLGKIGFLVARTRISHIPSPASSRSSAELGSMMEALEQDEG